MFLHILSIIGIVLLCIAAFVILILLLVLFMPFRYKITANGSGAEISAGAGVKWLFGFVRVKVDYSQSKACYKVKVLFINILKGEIGGKKEDDDPEKEPVQLSKKEIRQQQKKEEKDQKKEAAKAKKKEEKQAEKDKKAAEKEQKKKEEKEAAQNRNLKEKALVILDKIKNIWAKVKTVKYIWDAPVTKRALAFLKEKIFALLNHIKPRKIKGRVKFALSDPAMTAQIYAICAMFVEMFRYDLILEPDFEGGGVSLENVEIKGRIFAGYMLLLGLGIIKNKDVRRVIKYIRRNF